MNNKKESFVSNKVWIYGDLDRLHSDLKKYYYESKEKEEKGILIGEGETSYDIIKKYVDSLLSPNDSTSQ